MTRRRRDALTDWLRTQPLKVRRRFSHACARMVRTHRRWRDHHDWYQKHLARVMTEAVVSALRQPIEERAFYDTIEVRINERVLG